MTRPVLRTPAHAATGTLPYTTAEITSQPIITRRAGRRSTHAPAGKPMSSHGSHPAAVSTPTTNVLACSTMTATSGTPTTAMALPSWLTVSPIHSSRKLRCRSSPPNRRSLAGPPGRSPPGGSPARCLPNLKIPFGPTQRQR